MNHYTLIKTISHSKKSKGRWMEEDLSGMLTKHLLDLYFNVYITIHSSILNDKITFQMKDYIEEFSRFNGTLLEYLENNNNRSFKEIDIDVNLKSEKTVKYQDAFRSGFKLWHTPEHQHHDVDLDRDDRPYILMQKPNIDPEHIYKHCLVTVNGYVHRLDYSSKNLWIVDGMESINHSGFHDVGIMDFQEVGSLEIIPITENMIYRMVSNNPLYDQCYINIGKDTTDKTIILVLGGYFYIDDWLTYRRVGDKQIRIDIKNLSLMDKYFDSKRYLPYNDAPLDQGYDEGHVSFSDLSSDEFILYYLTMSQSFVVLLDNDNIKIDKLNLVTTRIPKQYVSHIDPIYPLIMGYGRMPSYWSTYDGDGVWSVNLSENNQDNYTLNTQNRRDPISYTDSRRTVNKSILAQASYLKITSVISKKKK